MISNVAALHCHLAFTLSAEAWVNQMSLVGVFSERGGAFRIGKGLNGWFSASREVFIGICDLGGFVCPLHFICYPLQVGISVPGGGFLRNSFWGSSSF